MAPRQYSMSFDGVTITNGDGTVDFFELIAPTAGIGRLLEVHIGQSSELSDAAEEQLRYAIVTGNTASGSGGSVGVEVPDSLGDAAATAVGETCNTTVASAGTEAVKHRGTFNVRTGLELILQPERRIPWSANRLCVRLLAAVTDDIVFSGTIKWEEED